jgi:hypothetical protein
MKLKHVIIGTIVWLVLIVVAGVGIAASFAGKPGAEQRAQSLGQGLGIVAAIGLGALWLPWAAKVGKKRREALLARQSAKGAAKKRRPPPAVEL